MKAKLIDRFCDDVPAIIAIPIRAVVISVFLVFIAGCATVTAAGAVAYFPWAAGRWFLDAVMDRQP